MKKKYTDKSVYQATQERLKIIFEEFDCVYVCLSGGKDSGVTLNLCLDYMRKNNISKKIYVVFIDLEAEYKMTVDFIKEIIETNLDLINPMWICLPLKSEVGISMYQKYWWFWDNEQKDKWTREMPNMDYVINSENQQFDFYHKDLMFEHFVDYLGEWFSKKYGKTACLVGIRTDESLNRFRAIAGDKSNYNGLCYTTKKHENLYNFYPIYDWCVNDIWTYNGKFQKPYNRFYDLAFRAGVSLHKMRICEPYGNEQKAGLNMFKIIEPETWVRIVDRVSGANFGNIYCATKATGTGKFTLPKGHTWKSYCRFLLRTLPSDSRASYTEKFVKFVKYWKKTGCPITDENINLLPQDAIINTMSYGNRGKGDKFVVKFKKIPDSVVIDSKDDFCTWKRMCMCIIKNDVLCKSLSFSQTKEQINKQKTILEKYKNL